jgi:hypothetical protein
MSNKKALFPFSRYMILLVSLTLGRRSNFILFALCGLTGCLSPMALDRAIIEYDKTANDILSKQILLNIARSHQHQPLHFTGISNIAATFNFQFNAGATPAITGNNGGLMTPVFGGTVAENPTISIIPIEGEEFTRRLLTPFQENKLTMLLRQGTDIDLVLRLLAGELRLFDDGHAVIYKNQPHNQEGYRYFRRAVSHLSSIQDRNQLFAEPIIFDEEVVLAIDTLTIDQLATLQKEYDEFTFSKDHKQLHIIKKMVGRIVLTNYDPNTLSNQERMRLHQEADQRAENDVMVDIRPGHMGGEWPIHGVFRLRSFYNVLNFVGQSIENDPEYPVEKHPKTPPVSENPASTLGLVVSKDQPDNADVSIEYNDTYYSLQPETGYQWNREGFRLLAQIFQMTISELNRQTAPAITISK